VAQRKLRTAKKKRPMEKIRAKIWRGPMLSSQDNFGSHFGERTGAII
jgi:hypothetical protein